MRMSTPEFLLITTPQSDETHCIISFNYPAEGKRILIQNLSSLYLLLYLLAGKQPHHHPVSRKDTHFHQVPKYTENLEEELLSHREKKLNIMSSCSLIYFLEYKTDR